MYNLANYLNFKQIIFNGKIYSQDEIKTEIDQLAQYISTHIRPNSPLVYLYAPNHIKTVVAYFAILKANKVCVLVEPDIGKLELEEIQNDAIPGAELILDQRTDVFEYELEVKINSIPGQEPDIAALEDVSTIHYTSANEGYAKGAMLTHSNMLSNAQGVIKCNRVGEESVSCSMIPFSHLFGLQTGLIAPCLSGGTLLIQDSDFSKIKTKVRQLKDANVSHLYSVPMVYYILARISDQEEIFSSVQSFVSGGYPLSEAIYAKCLNKKIKIHQGYGLTEASPICTWHRPEDKIKVNSVGRAFHDCEVKILNPNNEEMRTGEIGEICIKGKNVMKGYYNNPEASNKVIKDGWLRTYDLGKIDEDGYVYLMGLKKKMLNIGGRKVFPKRIERLLRRNKHVDSATVYSSIDFLQGDQIRTMIKTNEGGNDLNTILEWYQMNFAGYKQPKNYF